MKPRFLALLLFPLLALAADVPPGGSLITNGDFQLDSKGAGWPDDWKSGDPGTSWEKGEARPFLRFVSPAPGKLVMVYREVPIPPGVRGVNVTLRYRTKGVQAGGKPWFDARTIFHFLDAGREQLKPDAEPMVFASQTAEWQEKSARLLVPEHASILQVMPCLFKVAAGTLDLAAIRITAMEPSQADALHADTATAEARKAEQAAILEKELARPTITPDLRVSGRQIVTPDGKPVWLQGLSVDSMQWSQGENVLWSIRVAIDDWKANVIGLPVHDTFWFGKGKGQPDGGATAYRETIDKAVRLAAAKGAWVVLDLHEFGAPTDAHMAFWKDAAARYKNNPAVLFEIFNEPHGISWEVWRNGGSLGGENPDINPAENARKTDAAHPTGMQALVRAVRDIGAKNIVAVGGLDWAYDLVGVVNGHALDDLGGNGIIYVSHIYPWKRDWQTRVLAAAEKFPVIVTEVGCPRDYKDFAFIPESARHPLEGWSEDVLGMIQKHRLHWTGFSFHPGCGPQIIQDWNYTPTPFWGAYVKDALAGRPFEAKALR